MLIGTTHGLPQFLVLDGTPKCFSVEVPKETFVKIHYEAQGMLPYVTFDAM